MKRSMSARILSLCTLLLFSQRLLMGGNCGTSAPSWIGSVTAPVSDQNLTIDGSSGPVILPVGGTSITSNMCDITVTIANDAVVTTSTVSQLYVNAGPTRTITFDLSLSDLTFEGSNNTSQTPLLIVFGGAGKVVFSLGDGNSISFTNAAGRGGVEAYLYMGNPTTNTVAGTSTLQFTRVNSNSSNDVSIVVGPQSILSYVSNAPLNNPTQQIGNLEFYPSNSGITSSGGNMILDIKNTGAVVVSAQMVSVPLTSLTQSNLSGAFVHGGTNPNFNIVSTNSSATSRLLVTNENNTLSNLEINPCCLTPNPFNGTYYGFILSANGNLSIGSNTYLDYVGLTNNQCPPCGTSPSPCDFGPDLLIKKRNASAFIVDGSTATGAVPARISFGTCSALFFRSGVDVHGVVENPTPGPDQYTIDPINRTPGEGETVFTVEAPLNVTGQPTLNSSGLVNVTSKLEILSLEVAPTGAPLFIDQCNPVCGTIFPLRTFTKSPSGCYYNQYNAANFLVNSDLNLFYTAINHTDTIHEVFQKNDIKSEPAYIGGDSFLCKKTCRPRIIFCNSRLLVHENIAFTGLDLVVPNCLQNVYDCCNCPSTGSQLQCTDNVSKFIFYYNGRCCDAGTGRTMILGTQVGSMNCAGCSIISRDAHLDVMQTDNCPLGICTPGACTSTLQQLLLQVDANDPSLNLCMNQKGITCASIVGQKSIQTIFLGNNSNITVGGMPYCCPPLPLGKFYYYYR